MCDRQTKRQQLIQQVRTALHRLQDPNWFNLNETLDFTILDTEFELDEKTLNEFSE